MIGILRIHEKKIGNSPDKNSTQAKDHWTPSGTILNHKKLQSSCKAPEKSNEKNPLHVLSSNLEKEQSKVKFGYSEKATKFEKNLPLKIWHYSVTSNFKWKIF